MLRIFFIFSILICFLFDVGRWKFDVGRSSFKPTLYGYNAACDDQVVIRGLTRAVAWA